MVNPGPSADTRNSGALNVRRLVLTALFVALVTLATMSIHVPMPGATGYVNVGDTVIFVAAMMMGWKMAAVAGGIGSALADILLNYTYWAPWTLIIKGVEGIIAAAIGYGAFWQAAGRGSRGPRARLVVAPILAIVAAASWMVAAYTAATAIMLGKAAAIGALPGNGTQAVASVLIAIPILAVARALTGRVRI